MSEIVKVHQDRLGFKCVTLNNHKQRDATLSLRSMQGIAVRHFLSRNPYRDRHAVASGLRRPSLGEGVKRLGTTIRTRKPSVFRANAEL